MWAYYSHFLMKEQAPGRLSELSSFKKISSEGAVTL